MKQLLGLLLSFSLWSCNSGFNGDFSELQGYWQIESVSTNGQVVKAYQTNLVVDYFELPNEKSGVRKKLAPKLDGTFAKTNNSEVFRLIEEAGDYFIEFTTPYDSWREKVISLSETELILEDQEGTQYQYKPYEAVNILGDE
ncbi:lipocalin family protein [Gilvibacter sp.]|uniref:lipocalin family protein n=1 Tax=Gilvibacter sp. TaxID=2729997 RepID=UPI003F4A49DB